MITRVSFLFSIAKSSPKTFYEIKQGLPRRLTASLAESEHPVAEINYYFPLLNRNKLYEKSQKEKRIS